MAELRVGLCTHREVTSATCASMVGLAQSAGADAVFQIVTGCNLTPSRNQIVKDLKEPYLLLLDFDMTFSASHVRKLLDALRARPKLGAVSGLYVRWDGSCLPVANWKNDGKWVTPEQQRGRAARLRREKAIARVDSMGGGFLLIDAEVFEKVSAPAFNAHYDEDGWMGADTDFCQKLQKAGYQPSVHFGCEVGHMGPTQWMPEVLGEEVKVAV